MSRVKGGPVSLILEGRKVCLSVKNVRQTTYGAMWDEPSDRARPPCVLLAGPR
jgi:hypothetical protein